MCKGNISSKLNIANAIYLLDTDRSIAVIFKNKSYSGNMLLT